MNNKHQELIAEAVKDIAIRMVNGVENKTDILTQTLQETIDTVLEKERWRIKKEIVQQTLLNEGNDTFVNLGEALWVCDSKEEREVFLKALDKTPPNKV